MSSKGVLFVAAIAGLLALSLGTYWACAHAASGEAAGAFTRTCSLLGYEGIGTLGSPWLDNGRTPPVGDYVTTHCRYIEVQNTCVNQYFLRYPLHLPQGVPITKVALYVADYSPSGVLWAILRSRPWTKTQRPSWGSAIPGVDSLLPLVRRKGRAAGGIEGGWGFFVLVRGLPRARG